ncbi:collagen alpha-1(I) chain-like [Schistocerca gregaria]|uniref:collagen alpha-1(I) chain-like n=1 Tax=Schistocerca gregaria TaxID=7010 RepID=UPI00211E2B92|nr:collagen alpha-1(I) chain-like [Schistocerca gregaria]
MTGPLGKSVPPVARAETRAGGVPGVSGPALLAGKSRQRAAPGPAQGRPKRQGHAGRAAPFRNASVFCLVATPASACPRPPDPSTGASAVPGAAEGYGAPANGSARRVVGIWRESALGGGGRELLSGADTTTAQSCRRLDGDSVSIVRWTQFYFGFRVSVCEQPQ